MPRFEGSGERPTCPEGYYNATIVDFVDITDRVQQYADWAFELKLNAEDVAFELKSSYFIKFARSANGELDADNNGWSKQFNNLFNKIRNILINFAVRIQIHFQSTSKLVDNHNNTIF